MVGSPLLLVASSRKDPAFAGGAILRGAVVGHFIGVTSFS